MRGAMAAEVCRERGVFSSERVGPIAGAAGCICAPDGSPVHSRPKCIGCTLHWQCCCCFIDPPTNIMHQHAPRCSGGCWVATNSAINPCACARVEGWGWQHCARVQGGGWEGGWMHPGSHWYASATMHACIYKGGRLTFDPLTLLLYHSLAAYFT